MLAETRRLPHLLANLEGTPGQTVGRLDGLRLSSHFQPIYSLSHARVVGHEALLRAHDAQDKPVSPLDVFAACDTLPKLAWCDSMSRVIHLANFTADTPAAQWLFLNVHPTVHQLLAGRKDNGAYVRDVFRHFNIRGDQIVLEVVEGEMTDLIAFEESMKIVRDMGCLIAIDDFGAGHSNFDRVWRLQPDIVKLDRSLVARAALDKRARRVVSQMVSLLHECGAMVLMEGVETQAEALLAMESDADMVQGYFFGRPQAALMPSGHAPEQLKGLYGGLGELRETHRVDQRDHLSPYKRAIGKAAAVLGAGHDADAACLAFLALQEAELCYVLDAQGYQIGTHVWPASGSQASNAYEPLRESEGACWARRPYFRRAIEQVGSVQITRPYRTLHGNQTCITVSCAYHAVINGVKSLRVVCGDMAWHESAPDPEAA
jgi:EAL domain-containing protein (putative c-di-GMP-specific phosphodiesterase class I)